MCRYEIWHSCTEIFIVINVLTTIEEYTYNQQYDLICLEMRLQKSATVRKVFLVLHNCDMKSPYKYNYLYIVMPTIYYADVSRNTNWCLLSLNVITYIYLRLLC